jgi:hypothetical protein
MVIRWYLQLCLMYNSDYTFGIFDLQILITPLVSFSHSVLWFTYSDYTFGILWPLCCLPFDLQISKDRMAKRKSTKGQTIIYKTLNRKLKNPSKNQGWTQELQKVKGIFDLQILITPLVSMIYRFWLHLWYLWFTNSDYTFGILWPLCCLPFDLQILITPLVSLIYRFWLHLWYLS